jgi:hypothetical protein
MTNTLDKGQYVTKELLGCCKTCWRVSPDLKVLILFSLSQMQLSYHDSSIVYDVATSIYNQVASEGNTAAYMRIMAGLSVRHHLYVDGVVSMISEVLREDGRIRVLRNAIQGLEQGMAIYAPVIIYTSHITGSIFILHELI